MYLCNHGPDMCMKNRQQTNYFCFRAAEPGKRSVRRIRGLGLGDFFLRFQSPQPLLDFILLGDSALTKTNGCQRDYPDFQMESTETGGINNQRPAHRSAFVLHICTAAFNVQG